MNNKQKKMMAILRELQEEYGAVAVKAEFEAEGTRTDEMLRLADIASSVNAKLTIKIGGCEAVRDLIEARQFGADFVVAPMVESTYAIEKYSAAIDRVYQKEEKSETEFLINMETISALAIAHELSNSVSQLPNIAGFVFGRVDFSLSAGLGREVIEGPEITRSVTDLAKLSSEAGHRFLVGGAISPAAVPMLKKVRKVRLDRFETRKVVFDGSAVEAPRIIEGLLLAAQFELVWLEDKRDEYARVTREDESRIRMLTDRVNLPRFV